MSSPGKRKREDLDSSENTAHNPLQRLPESIHEETFAESSSQFELIFNQELEIRSSMEAALPEGEALPPNPLDDNDPGWGSDPRGWRKKARKLEADSIPVLKANMDRDRAHRQAERKAMVARSQEESTMAELQPTQHLPVSLEPTLDRGSMNHLSKTPLDSQDSLESPQLAIPQAPAEQKKPAKSQKLSNSKRFKSRVDNIYESHSQQTAQSAPLNTRTSSQDAGHGRVSQQIPSPALSSPDQHILGAPSQAIRYPQIPQQYPQYGPESSYVLDQQNLGVNSEVSTLRIGQSQVSQQYPPSAFSGPHQQSVAGHTHKHERYTGTPEQDRDLEEMRRKTYAASGITYYPPSPFAHPGHMQGPMQRQVAGHLPRTSPYPTPSVFGQPPSWGNQGGPQSYHPGTYNYGQHPQYSGLPHAPGHVPPPQPEFGPQPQSTNVGTVYANQINVTQNYPPCPIYSGYANTGGRGGPTSHPQAESQPGDRRAGNLNRGRSRSSLGNPVPSVIANQTSTLGVPLNAPFETGQTAQTHGRTTPQTPSNPQGSSTPHRFGNTVQLQYDPMYSSSMTPQASSQGRSHSSPGPNGMRHPSNGKSPGPAKKKLHKES